MELDGPIDSYLRGELALMRFAPTAVLYSDAGFPDSVLGVANPSSAPYRIQGAIRNAVTIEVTDAAGRRGRVQFLLPRTMSRFEVDPRADALPAPTNGPELYKEWRLRGSAKLSGILAGSGSLAGATLILHGDGNACSAAPNFKRWTLAVKGRRIAFTFLGDLVP
jgi:hypothetical protein